MPKVAYIVLVMSRFGRPRCVSVLLSGRTINRTRYCNKILRRSSSVCGYCTIDTIIIRRLSGRGIQRYCCRWPSGSMLRLARSDVAFHVNSPSTLEMPFGCQCSPLHRTLVQLVSLRVAIDAHGKVSEYCAWKDIVAVVVMLMGPSQRCLAFWPKYFLIYGLSACHMYCPLCVPGYRQTSWWRS